jgi:cytochrome oxidase Cu insertion factor (SCO1/SenC/PrrC family)
MPTLAIGLAVAGACSAAFPQDRPAQRGRRDEAAFTRQRPAISDALPDVTVYDVEGREVKTSSLRGHYTVLTFGCLT